MKSSLFSDSQIIAILNRKALAINIDLSLPAERVVRSLNQIIVWCGKPQH